MQTKLVNLLKAYIENQNSMSLHDVENKLGTIINRKVSCEKTNSGLEIKISVPWIFRSTAMKALNPSNIENILNENNGHSFSCAKTTHGVCITVTNSSANQLSEINIKLV